MKLQFTSFLAVLVSLAGLASTQAEQTISIAGYDFTTPENWTAQKPSSSMRKAELKFDAAGDNDPVAVFFEFGKSGIQANIDRWKGQFNGGPTEAKQEDIAEGVVWVELSGVYMESMGGPFSGNKVPKEGYKMLGVILEGENTAVFIKLTAPAAAADEAKESLLGMVKAAVEAKG